MLGGYVVPGLQPAKNLSDVASIATAIANLFVGPTDIVIAGSNASAVIKFMAGASVAGLAGYGTTITTAVCTGTADNLVINPILAALPPGTLVKLVGTFYLQQTIYLRTSYCTLDCRAAVINLTAMNGSPGWQAAGRAAVHLGINHQIPLGTPSLATVGGIPNVLTFAANSSGGAGCENGDSGYLTGGGTYPATSGGALNNSTRYFIVNYTPTGFGNANFNLSLSAGGSPIVCTSAGSGAGWVLVGYTAAVTASSNSIAFNDSSLTSFPAGTVIVLTSASIGSGLKNDFPVYLGAASSGATYPMFYNSKLTLAATSAASASVQAQLATSGIQMLGGVINVPAGSNSSVVGYVKDNVTNVGAAIDGVRFDLDSSLSADVDTSGNCAVYVGGTGTWVRNCQFTGGLLGIAINGVGSNVEGNLLRSVYAGIMAASQPRGCSSNARIANNSISYAQAYGVGISAATAITGAQILNNLLDSNNVYNPSNGAEIFIPTSATNTVVSGNTFTLTATEVDLIDEGVSTSLAAYSVAAADKSGASAISATTTLLTYNLGSAENYSATYEFRGYLNLSGAALSGSVQITAAITDEQGNAQSIVLPLSIQTGGIAGTASTSDYYSIVAVPLRAVLSGSIAITVTLTGSVATAFDVGGQLVRTR